MKHPLPEHILNKITPEERLLMGSVAKTAEEASRDFAFKKERDMHDIFGQWLTLHDIPFIHARMDRKSTIQTGWPDFTILFKGKALCIEFKMPGQKPDENQASTIDNLIRTGTPVFICHMPADAIIKTRETLKIPQL